MRHLCALIGGLLAGAAIGCNTTPGTWQDNAKRDWMGDNQRMITSGSTQPRPITDRPAQAPGGNSSSLMPANVDPFR